MGNICPCPCPKRSKKKDFTYDVHEETFDMDDNVQNIGEHSPKHHGDHDNNILTEELRSSEEGLGVHHQLEGIEKRDNGTMPLLSASQEHVSQNVEGQREHMLDNISAITMQSEPQQIVVKQIAPLVQQIQQSQQPPKQQKSKYSANILKPKVVKKKYNPDDYRFSGETDSFKVKKIDSIKEQQYNIQNCKKCQYFIFDITANVYIDDCEDCIIFIAPCQSTVFIRNCKRITLITATKQFRTFQCHQCIFSLYCKSQPVIQSSSELTIAPFEAPVYDELSKQFQKKRLQPWNNHWSQIHNFTKKQNEKHYTLVNHIDFGDQINWQRAFQQAELSFAQQQNCIPFINGQLPYQPKSQLLILINKGVEDQAIKQLLHDTVLLRAFQGVMSGEGKDEKKAILIDPLDSMPQKFQPIGRVVSDSQQIQTLKGKWFISFNDQRQK